MTRLAEQTLTSLPAVSVVVSRLVERGLVRRKPSTRDGRSVVLDIAPAGKRALEGAPESPASRVVAALRRLPRGELLELSRHLERLVDELGISALEPQMLFEKDTGDAPVERRRRTPVGTRS